MWTKTTFIHLLCYNRIAMVRELVEEFFRDLKQLSVSNPETIRGQNRPIRGQKAQFSKKVLLYLRVQMVWWECLSAIATA